MQDNIERLRQHEPFFDIWWLKDDEELGKGNSGVVYLISDGKVDAALKVISIPRDEEQLNKLYEAFGSESYVRETLEREYQFAVQEIEIMRRLKGLSNIVCFEDSKVFERQDTYGWDVIIRMERLIKLTEDLRRSMRRDQVLKMWTDLVTGLFYCERNGIVHLDIKPDNIFYTGANMNLYKLGDFGVSIRSDNGKVKEGIKWGSPAYMSPEIYHGQGGDIRSDIYSLGIVIYELFNNNCLPFMSRGVSSNAMDSAIQRRVTPGQEIPPIKGLDSALARILMRCVRYDPNDRYQTVRELHEDLQKYIVGPKPGPGKYLKILIAIGAAGIIGAAALVFMRPASRGALTFVGPAGIVDTASRTIMINARSTANSTLTLRGSAKSQVNFQIVDRASGTVMIDKACVLDESGEETVWQYGEERLVDGRYGFVAWYTDQPDNRETFEATVDTAAPEAPQIVGDTPYAGAADWVLTVSAEPGCTVSLLSDGVEAESAAADESGEVRFVRTFEPEVRYALAARDATGNESEALGFNAVIKRVFASLSEIDEDAETLTLEVEDGTTPSLTVNGEAVDSALLIRADSTTYTYQPAGGFRAGDSYVLTATDFYGLQGTAEWTVTESSRQKITLNVLNVNAQGRVEQRDIEVSGTAENGDTVYLTWNGVRVGGEIPVLDGEYRGYLSREDAGVETGETSGTVGAMYQYGALSKAAEGVAVQWAPGTEARPAVVEYQAIDISAIPGATVDENGAWVITARTSEDMEIGLFNGTRGQNVSVELIRDGEAVRSGERTLSSTSGAVTLDADFDGIEDGSYTLTVRYVDAPQAGEWRQALVVDRMPPDIELEEGPVYAGVDWSMNVTTEPGARLSLYDVEGKEIWSAIADDDGLARLEHVFEAGVDYRLIATDSHDNQCSPKVIRAEEKTVLAELSDVYEDSGELLLHIDADCAAFTLYRNGDAVDAEALTAEEPVDGEKRYSLKPSSGLFDKDDAYTLEVTDTYGLTATAETVVREARWAQIRVRVDNLFEADNAVYDRDLALTVSGEPGKDIELLWNDTTVGSINTGEGSVSHTLSLVDAGLPETGGEGTLSAHYALGCAGSKEFSGTEIIWTPDDSVALSLSPVREDSVAMVIDTDPDARLEIARQDDGSAPVVIEDVGEGHVEWTPDGDRFLKDEVYTVTATDHIGNRRQASVTVGQSTRAAITLRVENLFDWAANGVEPFYEEETVIEDAVRMAGTAEPGQRVRLFWNDAQLAEAEADAQGDFTVSVTDQEKYGGAGAIRAEYDDGRTPSLTASLNVLWVPDSGATLMTEDGALQLYWGGSLTVRTEPYAHVQVTFDGTELDLGRADADGLLSWTPEVDYDIGTSYSVRVTDIFGHTVSSGSMKVEEIQRAEISAEVGGMTESSYGERGITAETLSLSGFAEPGTALSVDFNDRAMTVETGADGAFELRLEHGDAVRPGDTVTLTISYADGASASRTLTFEPFIWDWSVGVMPLGQISEDTQSLEITASEPIAATLYCREAMMTDWVVVETRQSDDALTLSWPLNDGSHPWQRGDAGRVVVSDRWGNSQTLDFTVQPTALRDITGSILTASGGSVDGMGVVTDEVLTVSGTAQPERDVEVTLLTGDWKMLAIREVHTGGDGSFTATFSADDPENGYSDGGTYLAVIGYPWEQARVSMTTVKVRWDYRGPDVTIADEAAVDASWKTIRGATEPGARVVLDIDGARLETDAADGSFAFERRVLYEQLDDVMGKTLTITAYDEVGNPGTPWEITFEQASYPAQIDITNLDADGGVTGSLRVEGWFAGFDTFDAQISIVSESGKDLGSVRPEYREMSEDEKTSRLGGKADAYGKYCYDFSVEYDLARVPAGACRLVLKHSDFYSEEELVSVPFTVIRSAAQSNSAVIEEDVAMDVDAVTRSFPGDGIVLTGWIYQSENAADSTTIHGVQISSVSGATDDVMVVFEAEQDRSENPATLAEGTGFAMVDREVSREVDAAVRARVTGVSAASNHRAGFLVNLGATEVPLPNGEYTIRIVFLAGETYRSMEIGPVNITVDSGAAAVTAGQINQWLAQWRPVEVVPEPTMSANSVG